MSTLLTPTARPFMRFYFSAQLYTKTLVTLAQLEQARDCTRHHRVLAALVVELTEAGLTYCLLRPLQLVQAGRLAEQAAAFGLHTIKQLSVPVVYNILSQLTAGQLLGLCQYIRELMT